ncbi:MAG: Flp family type IVb pilin [Mariniblastus sp.]
MIHKIKTSCGKLVREEDGPTTVEYALLIATIAAFCMSSIFTTGEFQKVLWFDTATTIQNLP